MEQETFPITLKQKKQNNEEQLRAKKIPDDYHTQNRTRQVTLIHLGTGHRLNSHMHKRINLVQSPLCTCGTEDQQQTIYCRDVQYTNISDNIYGQTEYHYTRSCMGRKKN